MRKAIFYFIVCAVFVYKAAAFGGGLPVSAELEYFGAADSVDGLKEGLNQAVNDQIINSYSQDTSPGFGLKVSYWRGLSEKLDMGLSADYIIGPKSDIEMSMGALNLKVERKLSFARFMGDIRAKIPLGRNWIFKPGFSAGWAFSKVKYEKDGSGSENWNGFTGELNAPFIYNNFIFAAKYIILPNLSDSSDYDIKWHSLGFSLGWQFGEAEKNSGPNYPDDSYSAPRDIAPPAETNRYDYPDSGAALNESELSDENIQPVIETPKESSAEEGYQTYLENAEDYFARGKYEDAFNEFGNASESIPAEDSRQVYILSRQGAILVKQKNCPRAKRFYMASVKTAKKTGIADKNVVNAYLGLAYCQGKEGNVKWAVANYKAALRLSDNPNIKRNIENILSKLEY